MDKAQTRVPQLRPSVLRKGNQPFPQDAQTDQTGTVQLSCDQHDDNVVTHAAASCHKQSHLEKTEKHQSGVPGLLCVEGQCRWPGCPKSKEVFKEYIQFLRHLVTDHCHGDRSLAQLKMQRDKVQYLEFQLMVERQKFKAMQLHLTSIKPNTEPAYSMEEPEHLKDIVPPAAFQKSRDAHDSEKVTADALARGNWHISTSPAIPGIIPSFEYYKYTNIRPPFTYASMIRWAILESTEKQLTLNEIYHWFAHMFFYFRHNTATWKNAVRHNLSLHKCFVRVEGKKGSVWTVDEEEYHKRKGQKFQRDQGIGWMTPFHLFPFALQGETLQM